MRKAAFTLIELLVVIVIIGLLTSVATASYLKAQQHSRDSARRSTVNAIAIAVETYYTQQHSYPGDSPSASAVTTDPCKGTTQTRTVEANPSNSNSPFYYFSPNAVCDTTYVPAGTWIPGLGQYLNPFPIETRFQSCNGTGTVDANNPFIDYMDSSVTSPSGGGNAVCNDQISNYSRSYVYRNLGTGYMVYARMESGLGSDTYPDFCVAFTSCGSLTVSLANNAQNSPSGQTFIPFGINSITDSEQNRIRPYLIRK